MYRAPIKDILFVLNQITDLEQIMQESGFTDYDAIVEPILEEAAKFTEETFAPLNRLGDQQGAHLKEGVVHLPEGFKKAYDQFVEGGWGSMQFGEAYGGQGLPFLLSLPVQEMIQSANLSFSLCPLLTQGAIAAIDHNASDLLKDRYLPNLISGKWCGTMNLTESHAGSDLSTIRTQALPDGDRYRIKGQKIFITWGDHEMAENIIHLVLARLPDAPDGTRGISLFLVPKFLVNDDGTLGERNDCYALSLEEKMGLHACPTAVMSFGDNEGAIGYLVGEENRGLISMFTMMNSARLAVGLQGVSIAEYAYQLAQRYSDERVQGRAIGFAEAGAISRHPDVQRMLMQMKALTQGARALAYWGCQGVDKIKLAAKGEDRAMADATLALVTPLVKTWCTEIAQEVVSLGIQCHGGTGFIEESGAPQLMRDARILPIYEGTNGIQALDLIFRKILKDEGTTLMHLMAEMRHNIATHFKEDNEWSKRVLIALDQVDQRNKWLFLHYENRPLLEAIAFDYLMFFSTILTSYLMLMSMVKANDLPDEARNDKIEVAQYYLLQILPRYLTYDAQIENALITLPLLRNVLSAEDRESL